MVSKRVEKFLTRMRAREAELPRFVCACGQELWAQEDAQFVCARCFGAFRLAPTLPHHRDDVG